MTKKTDELAEAQRLMEVTMDAPTIMEIAGHKHYIRGLKLGTQVLIAEEVCKIQRDEDSTTADLIKRFARSTPAIIHCIALAVLNEKDAIFSDWQKREYTEEYRNIVERITWESRQEDWLPVLVEIIGKLDISFFLTAATQMEIIKSRMTQKRTAAHSSSTPGQS